MNTKKKLLLVVLAVCSILAAMSGPPVGAETIDHVLVANQPFTISTPHCAWEITAGTYLGVDYVQIRLTHFDSGIQVNCTTIQGRFWYVKGGVTMTYATAKRLPDIGRNDTSYLSTTLPATGRTFFGASAYLYDETSSIGITNCVDASVFAQTTVTHSNFTSCPSYPQGT